MRLSEDSHLRSREVFKTSLFKAFSLNFQLGPFTQLSALASFLLLHIHAEWDNVWKSRGGIMVNGVPRPKPEGPQARRVLVAVLPEGLHSP